MKSNWSVFSAAIVVRWGGRECFVYADGHDPIAFSSTIGRVGDLPAIS